MIVPLCLVATSTALDIGLKLSKRLRLHRSKQQTIFIIHAFTIEAIQLLLLIFGIIVIAPFVTAIEHGDAFAGFGFLVPAWLVVPATIATYALAIFAIDIIDNLIQLGRWTHPVQIQTLILTRSKLLPSSVLVKRKQAIKTRKVNAAARPPRRTRALSEPVTPTMMRRAEVEIRRRDSTPVEGQVARLVETYDSKGGLVPHEFSRQLGAHEEPLSVGKPCPTLPITPESLPAAEQDTSPPTLSSTADSPNDVQNVIQTPVWAGTTEAYNTKERTEIRSEKSKPKDENKPVSVEALKQNFIHRLSTPKTRMMLRPTHEQSSGSPRRSLRKKDARKLAIVGQGKDNLKKETRRENDDPKQRLMNAHKLENVAEKKDNLKKETSEEQVAKKETGEAKEETKDISEQQQLQAAI